MQTSSSIDSESDDIHIDMFPSQEQNLPPHFLHHIHHPLKKPTPYQPIVNLFASKETIFSQLNPDVLKLILNYFIELTPQQPPTPRHHQIETVYRKGRQYSFLPALQCCVLSCGSDLCKRWRRTTLLCCPFELIGFFFSMIVASIVDLFCCFLPFFLFPCWWIRRLWNKTCCYYRNRYTLNRLGECKCEGSQVALGPWKRYNCESGDFYWCWHLVCLCCPVPREDRNIFESLQFKEPAYAAHCQCLPFWCSN